MCSKYEIPEEVNQKRLMTMGKEVEMKTFKTFFKREKEGHGQRKSKEKLAINILCFGTRTKGILIKDYLQVTPPVKFPYLGPVYLDFSLKVITPLQNQNTNGDHTKYLQIWEIPESERCSGPSKIFLKLSQGALIFWTPRRPSSLNESLQWRMKIKEASSSTPCVLMTDNIPYPCSRPLQSTQPGKIFDSDTTLDLLCQQHDFIGHFEISSRDWKSGDNSVFGHAVSFLLHKILQDED